MLHFWTMIHNLVVNTLIGLGIDVIDLGLSTTLQLK
jgi:phosphomannomutase